MPAWQRSWIGKVVLGLAACLTIAGVAALAADDVRAHRALPADTPAARSYMTALVREDAAGMWQAYSDDARVARGGNRAAYIAYMQDGARQPEGAPNAFRLVAHIPLSDGMTLLYYQVNLKAGKDHILVPVLIDPNGKVDDAGNDGITFRPVAASQRILH